MGRASAKGAELTREKILASALTITLTEGFEAITFTKLSSHCGVSRSGINGHFPRKEDIKKALEPLISERLVAQMDFSSPDNFYRSWVEGLEQNSEFRAAVLAAGPIIPTEQGVAGLMKLIQGEPDEVMQCIYTCIGYALVHLGKK